MSRTEEGEGEDGTSRLPKGVRLTAVCPMVIASGGEIEAVDSGGVYAEGAGVRRWVGLGKVAMIPCVARVMTGFGEVADMQRLLVVVWATGCKETGTEMWFSSRGDASARPSSTRSETFGVKGSGLGLERGEVTSVVSSLSGGTASTAAVEVESSWM